jgi:hypothetical protein
MKKIKEILDLWFDQSDKAKCKQLYPNDCNGCPFLFQPDVKKGYMACNTIWLLIEKAAKSI